MASASDFQQRAVSALILIPPVLAAVYFGNPYFELLTAVVFLLMLREWLRMSRSEMGWLVLGLCYIALSCWFLVALRAEPGAGQYVLFWLLAVVWATDTAAYLVGRKVGGPKLAPALSPGKTISGAIGGLMGALLVSIVAWALSADTDGSFVRFMLVTVIASLACQAGDLLESGAKRHFQVKDTGSLIPGHGGVLDRMDGLLAAGLAVGAMDRMLGGLGLWM